MKTVGSKQKAEGSKEKTEGRKGLRFWLVALLALLVGMATPSYGRSHGSVATGIAVTITLRVFNYADASAWVVAQAEKEADYIFGQAGVKVIWWDCLASSAEPVCSEPIELYNLTLRILPGEPKREAALDDGVLGFAAIPTIASVFSAKVKVLAESVSAEQEYPTLLGDAIAHEVGHLLLGPGHSQEGIMQADWQAQTLRHGIKRILHFTPEQAERIRAEASARVKSHDDQFARTRANGNPKTSASVK